MQTSTGSEAKPVPVVATEIHRLCQPLKEPYHLAFGTFDAFDTFLVGIRTEDGQSAWGEATACTGYVPETGNDIWSFLCTHAPELIGSTPAEQVARLLPFTAHQPFAVAPLLGALERLCAEPENGPGPGVGEEAVVPLVGILSGNEEASLEHSFWTQIERGHTTVKLKVGFDLEGDLRRAAFVQELARQAPGVKIRVDANQGYSLDDARRFVRGLSPEVVELFEQPFDVGDWESQRALAPSSPVPLMLDESILGTRDIERAARLGCADYVKFKLMKAGSARRLSELIALARRLGLKVILGNGVAGEIGCYHEAVASLEAGLETAGEMNGFLKVRRSVLTEPIKTKAGGVVVAAALDPAPSPERLSEIAVERREWTQTTC